MSDYEATPCTSALIIEGEHFWCDLNSPHSGLAHSSYAAEAIWGEAGRR